MVHHSSAPWHKVSPHHLALKLRFRPFFEVSIFSLISEFRVFTVHLYDRYLKPKLVAGTPVQNCLVINFPVSSCNVFTRGKFPTTAVAIAFTLWRVVGGCNDHVLCDITATADFHAQGCFGLEYLLQFPTFWRTSKGEALASDIRQVGS